LFEWLNDRAIATFDVLPSGEVHCFQVALPPPPHGKVITWLTAIQFGIMNGDSGSDKFPAPN